MDRRAATRSILTMLALPFVGDLESKLGAQQPSTPFLQYTAGFPHQAFGLFTPDGQPQGYWQTDFKLSNSSNAPATITLHHFSQEGKPYALSLNGERNTDHTYTIPANGAIDVLTDITREPTDSGWTAAEYTSTGIHGQILFKLHHPNGQETQATVPMVSPMQGRSLFSIPGAPNYISITPFDNTNGNTTGAAYANTTNRPITLRVQMYDSEGASLGDIVKDIPPFGQTAATLPWVYTQTAGKKGTLRVMTPGITTMAIMLDARQEKFTTLVTDYY